jgi:hypothetical protein
LRVCINILYLKGLTEVDEGTVSVWMQLEIIEDAWPPSRKPRQPLVFPISDPFLIHVFSVISGKFLPFDFGDVARSRRSLCISVISVISGKVLFFSIPSFLRVSVLPR